MENVPNGKPMRLIGWSLPGTIREIDRERVRFIVRCIVQPPERPDDSHGRLLTGKEGVG